LSKQKIPKDFLTLIESISNKRARIVIDHIIEHGFITTEDLEKKYGYNHPPRAVRDVREAGIPLETYRTKSSEGNRNIAAYKFGDFETVCQDRIKGRISWPKNFKNDLIQRYGAKCLISGAELEPRALQIDHRIPYQLAGDDALKEKLDVEDFMLVSSTSNRAKSWSCEHCQNWIKDHDYDACRSCYWAFPENYSHVAMREIRRLNLTWQDNEVKDYDNLKEQADKEGSELPDYVKDILKKNIK
jgi:hypothetical protein